MYSLLVHSALSMQTFGFCFGVWQRKEFEDRGGSGGRSECRVLELGSLLDTAGRERYCEVALI